MLTSPDKQSPSTTTESWFTPHKHKNPSSIQTNPSMNPVSFYSNHCSSIELSESLAESPSFYSPNRELGSFLMTPVYDSKSKLPSGSELMSDLRLRTESLVETSRFYDLTDESKKSLPQSPSNQVKELMKLINQIRTAKAQKTYQSRKIVEQTAFQSFLQKQISQKQESILSHKLLVEEKINKKNKLSKKLKQKKMKIKKKTDQFINDLSLKVQKLKQELDFTCSMLNLENRQIQRFQHQVYQMNTYMHQYPFSYQVQQPNQMIQSKAEQLNFQNIPGFYSNPSSSRSQSNQMKRSNETPREGQNYVHNQNLFFQQALIHGLSSMMNSKDSNNKEKLRKFSFGQNPSFCMEVLQDKHGSKKQRSPQNSDAVPKSNSNPINEAITRQLSQFNQQQNPQQTSPIKNPSQNNKDTFLTQQFQNISPIAGLKKVKFNNQIAREIQKNSSDQKTFGAIIHEMNAKDEQSEHEVEYYNESLIDINEDLMMESKDKRSPRILFNRKASESPQHKRSPSNQTAKKSFKLPLVLEQSAVNIACESSTYSDNVQAHEFSPRKEEQVKRRMRSPTHQVMPAIHEEMYDLRKTDNKLKTSNNKEGSSRHSGADTPIFRSENSEEDANIAFSRPFLGGSMKESEILQNEQYEPQKSKITRQKQSNDRDSEQRAYKTTLLNQSKKSEPYSIYQTQAMRTIKHDEEDPLEQIEQSDDDFYSCTLKTESKVFVQSTIKSKQQNEESQAKSNRNQQNKIQSSKTRYQNEQSKDVNLVLQNAKNKSYDMSLNLSELGNKKYQSNQKRGSLELQKKGQSVELQRASIESEQNFSERKEMKSSKNSKDHSKSTL